MVICALDLSLTSTGYAVASDGRVTGHGALPGKGKDVPRLIHLRDVVMQKVESCSPRFVIMEDLALGSQDGKAAERAGLAFMVRAELVSDGIRWVTVNPGSLKKFVTGSGANKKEQMLKEVFRRWGHDVMINDEADAIGVAYVGMALTGEWAPTMDAQRQVLETVRKSNDLSWLTTPNLK